MALDTYQAGGAALMQLGPQLLLLPLCCTCSSNGPGSDYGLPTEPKTSVVMVPSGDP